MRKDLSQIEEDSFSENSFSSSDSSSSGTYNIFGSKKNENDIVLREELKMATNMRNQCRSVPTKLLKK